MADILLREFLPRLEVAGARNGRDFELCVNPEFLREGTAVWAPTGTMPGVRTIRVVEPLA